MESLEHRLDHGATMRAYGGTLKTFLDGLTGDAKCWRADLVTVTLRDLTVYHWTTADIDLSIVEGISPVLYYASGGGSAPVVHRGPYRQSANLSIDVIDVSLGGPFTIGGKRLGQLAVEGYFDGASVVIHHLMGAYPGDISQGYIGSWFSGPVMTAEPAGTSCILRCSSGLTRFNANLPKFTTSAQCGNALYDVNCKVAKGTYEKIGTVDSGTLMTIRTSTADLLAKPTGYYDQGALEFSTGPISGTMKTIATWVNYTTYGVITIAMPFTTMPNNGNSFLIWAGCDRSFYACDNTFHNLARFRGFPLVPEPEAGE
jgi:uncharacterized phage protein (TIGR02218 family)